MHLRAPAVFAFAVLSIASACGGDEASSATGNDGGVTGDGSASGSDGGSPGADAAPGTDGATPGKDGGTSSGSTAAGLAKKLRGKSNFMIGMGTSQNDTYTLGVTMDLHYEYLVGVAGEGGDWPSWNTDAHGPGAYVNVIADSSAAHGTTPMFTVYMMATRGDGNIAVTADDGFMQKYWDAAKLVMTRLAIFGKPAVVQIEPDFWAYALQKSPDASGTVKISGHAPDCAGVPDTFAGMGACWLKLRDVYAPKAVIGFHTSSFGTALPATIAFYKAIGAQHGDFVTTDMLDRDAGCFEAHTDPNCQRTEGGWYWDETNATHPNFHDHFAWVKSMTDALGVPMIWWQVPFGVPSATPGGTAGHYRDNRVHYMFGHMDELVAAGGAGAAFGTGAGNQTYINTDGNQFKNAVGTYFAMPKALP